MANIKFTTRLRCAVQKLVDDRVLQAVACRSGSLFSPVYRDNKYVWVKVMDSDGILIAERGVDGEAGNGAAPSHGVSLLIGVVIQSEDSTSQTKANPLGKAALSHIPYGVWVDTNDAGRRRLDRVLVVFVLPKGTAAERRKPFVTARRNVLNASSMMPDSLSIEVDRGKSADAIADQIRKEVQPHLVG